jgi:dolichyl-phosphate beta-glucosyltransferase
MTTNPQPDLHRHESEKFFTDPKKPGSRIQFPSISDPPSVDLSVVVPAYNEEERCKYRKNSGCLDPYKMA